MADKDRKVRDIQGLLGKKPPLPSQAEVIKSVAMVTRIATDNPPIEDFPAPPPTVFSEVEPPIESEQVKSEPNQTPSFTDAAAIEQTRKERGRPKKDRTWVKFTTMIDPEKRDNLKVSAIRQGKNVADILDEIIAAYLENQ